MATDKKTSDETAAGPLDGTELVRVVQDGDSVQTTAQDIADLAPGGALTRFVETFSDAAPNSPSAPAVGLVGDDSTGTSVDVAFGPFGNGSIAAQVPDGTGAGGNKRGTGAVDWQSQRAVATEVASGQRSSIGGGYRNTAGGAYSHIGGGRSGVASGDFSGVLSGDSGEASGTSSAVVGGGSGLASGNYATVLNGYNNIASGIASLAGGRSATTRGVSYTESFGNETSNAGSAGSSQNMRFHQRIATSDATPTELTANGSVPSAADVSCILPSYFAYAFTAKVIARQDSGSTCAGFIIEGVVKRAGAGAATLVGTPTIRSWHDAGAASWTAIADVITSPQALVIIVTGEAAKSINWRCTIDTDQIA